MKKYQNFAQLHLGRELDARYTSVIQDRFQVSPNMISRLGMYGELDGHAGCVNCLEWNTTGQILASGSDDVHIHLWNPYKQQQLLSMPTGHHGNIFTVKFVPNTGDNILISGAADHSVRVFDIASKETLRICTCHTGRVKRCATDPMLPHLFWSCGEDGVILQHDLRVSHTCPTDPKTPKNVIIDLKDYMGAKAEAKCLTVNPIRTEMIAVGANDPFVRLYDRRMIVMRSSTGKSDIVTEAVQYFVPGHLPPKITEYKRKYRSLASTYVAFSPDGQELLVNLGGEQIYLFPMGSEQRQASAPLFLPEFNTPACKEQSNANGYSNGYKHGKSALSDAADHLINGASRPYTTKYVLPAHVEMIKVQANQAYDQKNYLRAIHFYNEALRMSPKSAILFANRAAALLKRKWDGDTYVALKDCQNAIALDPDHFKAHLRLGRCLFELKRYAEAANCLRIFKHKFPLQVQCSTCKCLDADLNQVFTSASSSSSSDSSPKSARSSSSSSSSADTNRSQASVGVRTRTYFLRMTAPANTVVARNNTDDVEDDNEDADNSPESMELDENIGDNGDSGDSSVNSIPSTSSSSSERSGHSKRIPVFHESEESFQSKAIDFSARFCGHCNTTTDIKEANFFGNYVVAGSDDGSFFIWDKATGNIVKSLKGDESIVNCLQPHPSTCMLATSGIESLIRLWAPLPEDGRKNDKVVDDVNDAAHANQKRMNSNPFEMILMNMGYRITEEDQGSDEDTRDAPVQCNPS